MRPAGRRSCKGRGGERSTVWGRWRRWRKQRRRTAAPHLFENRLAPHRVSSPAPCRRPFMAFRALRRGKAVQRPMGPSCPVAGKDVPTMRRPDDTEKSLDGCTTRRNPSVHLQYRCLGRFFNDECVTGPKPASDTRLRPPEKAFPAEPPDAAARGPAIPARAQR